MECVCLGIIKTHTRTALDEFGEVTSLLQFVFHFLRVGQ